MLFHSAIWLILSGLLKKKALGWSADHVLGVWKIRDVHTCGWVGFRARAHVCGDVCVLLKRESGSRWEPGAKLVGNFELENDRYR